MPKLVKSIGEATANLEEVPAYVKMIAKKDDKKVEIEGIIIKGDKEPVGYFEVKPVDGDEVTPYKIDEFVLEFADVKGMITEEQPFEITQIFKYEDIAEKMVKAYGGKIELS
jgi:hypothetical protein